MSNKRKPDVTRRGFIKGAAAGSALAGFSIPASANPARKFKIGLIGCGGRGSGAAGNAMQAAKTQGDSASIYACADLFKDRAERARRTNNIPKERTFVGFDGFRKLLDLDLDYVILATPPHFRPEHFASAIAAGKNVFTEKPVAVDAPGIRRFLAAGEAAKKAGLSVAAGTQRRHQKQYIECQKRVADGAIGQIVNGRCYWNMGGLWTRKKEDGWADVEWQIRNWLYFTWLSGDHIVEQHIHSLDKALWLMDDQPPKVAFGLGGRQMRTEEKWGHVFDHFAVCYEWENGAKTFAFTRQMSGCSNNVEDYVQGTKGSARILHNSVTGGDTTWRYRGAKPSMYDVEHKELFAAIRSGDTINNGTYMSYSTMLAILGREVCYTGKSITWDQAMKSEMDLSPTQYEFGPVEVPAIAQPGKTPFA